jgi:serine/threonine protein kinase
VRSENLKKYNVLGQIGEGAQAKVYKIQRKQRVPNDGKPSKAETIFAIKVINKDKLLKRS